MDEATTRVEFLGKRYTFLGHEEVQLRIGSYILYIARNLSVINKKLAEIIIKGFDENEKCISLCEDSSKDEIIKVIEKSNKPVDQLTRHGQLVFVTERKHLIGMKDLSLDTFFCQLQGFVDDTCLQGWSALRLILDIQWLIDAGAKSKEFLENELEIFKRFTSTRIPLLLVSYLSGTQISPKNLIEITNSHPMILLDDNFMTSSIADTANIDNLTGLFNQTYFREILTKEIARCKRYKRPCSVVIFDVDDFKHINRQYGYTKGDELLLDISNILIKNIRNVDIPGRFAGEEFSVLLPETLKDGASVMANRILKLVAESVSIEDFPVTLSAGIAQFPDDAENEVELVERALQALRLIQRKGKNRVGMLEDSSPVP